MAATKKVVPFSRLRYSRTRKNGTPVVASSKSVIKSSKENASIQYPPYFTVDDLASVRRKKLPQFPDNLRPSSGKFGPYKSEYRKKYRSFVIDPEMEMGRKRRGRRKSDNIKVDGDREFNPEYGESYVEHHIDRMGYIKPEDNLETCSSKEFTARTVYKDTYNMFKEARRAALVRRPTSLKMEGELDKSTEYFDKFVNHPITRRPELLRRHTNMMLEGERDLITEKMDKYRPYVTLPRPALIRRYSNIEIPRQAFETFTEYNHAFKCPESFERRPLIRSLENLRMEGNHEYESEYTHQFVKHDVQYPQIMSKSTDPQLKSNSVFDPCEMKEVIGKTDYRRSPEYKHSFVRHAIEKREHRRPSTNLMPPLGIEEKESEKNAKYKPYKVEAKTRTIRPSTHLKQEGKQHMTPEYKASYKVQKPDIFVEMETNAPRGHRNTLHPPEKAFSVLEVPHVEDNDVSTHNRSPEVTFRKGKRHPTNKTNLDDSDVETAMKRPPFRMEVTVPDKTKLPTEKSFVVLDNNGQCDNKWSRNRERNWTPSWAKM